MKYYNCILFFVFLQLLSCTDDKSNLMGTYWRSYNVNNFASCIGELKFNNKEVVVCDGFGFIQSYSILIRDELLFLEDSNSEKVFKTNFGKSGVDTLLLFDSVIFKKDDLDLFPKYEEYELLKIRSNNLADCGEYAYIVHYYRNTKDELKLRLNETTRPLKDILLFLQPPHNPSLNSFKPEIFFFLGNTIQLEDLVKLYDYLIIGGNYKVNLISGRNDMTSYFKIENYIHLWTEELISRYEEISLVTPLPPMPPPQKMTRFEFLENGAKEIDTSISEWDKELKSYRKVENLLVKIDTRTPINNYLEVLKTLNMAKERSRNRYIIEFE